MTKKALALQEALYSISIYVLPTYTIEDKKYVPLEYAEGLRNIAKEALAKK